MCNFKSFLVLKPETDGVRPKILHAHGIDSHERLIEKFSVRERSSASAKDQPFARVECEPKWDKDVRTDAGWSFKLDEDRTPDWWSGCSEAAEQECKRICKSLVFDGRSEHTDTDFIILDGSAVARGASRGWALGSSSVEALGSSRVVAMGSSSVVAMDFSSVEALGSSSVVATCNSCVRALGASSVEALGYSRVETWNNNRVENKSKYSICVRRLGWDGAGYPFELIPFVSEGGGK